MKQSEYERRVLKVAKELMEAKPTVTVQFALRHAKDIAKTRETYKVSSEEKIIDPKKTKWKDRPEHVRSTIARQNKAERQRKKEGRSLPKMRFLSGGKVSPK
jgi:hypothetical protein